MSKFKIFRNIISCLIIMVYYKCLRCGFSSQIRCRFIGHLNRKFTCHPKLSNISLEEIYKKYFPRENLVAPENEDDSEKVVTEHKCDLCNTIFKHKRSLTRHKKRNCKKIKSKKKVENMQVLIDFLNDQLEKKNSETDDKDGVIHQLMEKLGIKKNRETNVQISVNPFKKTDLSHLTDKDYLEFLKHANFCVPYMLKKVHFDINKPENQNIYISNIGNAFVKIFDGEQWNIHDRGEIVDDIVDDFAGLIEDKIIEWEEKGMNNLEPYKKMINKFNKFMEKKDIECVSNKIKKEVEFALFNNRQIILERQKQLKFNEIVVENKRKRKK